MLIHDFLNTLFLKELVSIKQEANEQLSQTILRESAGFI